MFRFTFGSAICATGATVLYFALRPLPYLTREEIMLFASPAVLVLSVAAGLLGPRVRWIACAILCALLVVTPCHSRKMGELGDDLAGPCLFGCAAVGLAIVFVVGRFRDWTWPGATSDGTPCGGQGATDDQETA